MPMTLRRASLMLALVALVWTGTMLVAALVAAMGAPDTEPAWQVAAQGTAGSGGKVALAVLGIFQAALCVLVRTGRHWVRVALTASAVLTGLMALSAVGSVVLMYVDLTERAEVLGGEVHVTGPGIAGIAVSVLAAGFTVVGLVQLYRRSTSEYFADVRQLRLEARSVSS